ncbi:hypothetical protein [Salinarimonas rosea]|uniref:hypothetical protein n=1 Tax=Salinarimonas rosea TaxID=552063 RepID=UPI000404C4ED|nr:hypothetical protein [Salinarimonas rosea]
MSENGTDVEGEFLLPMPEGAEARPFVLAFVEKTAWDRLQGADLVFSEAVGGLEVHEVREKVEASGGSGTAGIDTTFSF